MRILPGITALVLLLGSVTQVNAQIATDYIICNDTTTNTSTTTITFYKTGQGEFDTGDFILEPGQELLYFTSAIPPQTMFIAFDYTGTFVAMNSRIWSTDCQSVDLPDLIANQQAFLFTSQLPPIPTPAEQESKTAEQMIAVVLSVIASLYLANTIVGAVRS